MIFRPINLVDGNTSSQLVNRVLGDGASNILKLQYYNNKCYTYRVVHENETDNKLSSKNNQPQNETGPNDTPGKMGVLFFKLR